MSDANEKLINAAYEVVSNFGSRLQEWDAGLFSRVCDLWDEIHKADPSKPLPTCLPHIHAGGGEGDICGKCGRDLREAIHASANFS